MPAIPINHAPVVRFIQGLFEDAAKRRASDIHFEPYRNYYRIRFRIDGMLHEITRPPIELAGRIATRLKIMAQLDISERRLPQDGRLAIEICNKSRDCRINTCPTLFGEKLVIRMLYAVHATLEPGELGLECDQKDTFSRHIHRPQGLILVTGPTGSGKTVTLYSALKQLNKCERNIVTIEDPVEIELEGINQVHVNPKAGLTFSHALRAFLRQDPDVIMVGEIRDLETAEIAIRAAQTGHLVLSTLHTKSAIESLIRLHNMGISLFDMISTVTLIIAQRLVRRLCPSCKRPLPAPAPTPKDAPERVHYEPNGCENCTDGYKGRVGIFEFMQFSDEMVQRIMQRPELSKIIQTLKELNQRSLHENALNKVYQGDTSLMEINRVFV